METKPRITKQTEHVLWKGNSPYSFLPHALSLTWSDQCQKPFGLHNQPIPGSLKSQLSKLVTSPVSIFEAGVYPHDRDIKYSFHISQVQLHNPRAKNRKCSPFFFLVLLLQQFKLFKGLSSRTCSARSPFKNSLCNSKRSSWFLWTEEAIEAQGWQSVVARSQRQQLRSGFPRSQGLPVPTGLHAALPEPSHCCSILLNATYFGTSSWQNTQLYFHLSIPHPSNPLPYPNSCLVAKRERHLYCRRLHEPPLAVQNTSSFLVSTSLGHCQVQSKLRLTWVTSNRLQQWASLEQKGCIL